MAALIVNQGLQRIGINASAVGGSSTVGSSQTTTRYLMTMSWDDSTVAFAATDTALNTGGAVSNEFDQFFDAFPTRSGQAVTHTSTIPTGSGNFTIKRVAIHDDTSTNVTTSSTTLCAGVDGQSLTKTSSFTLATSLVITYS